jgi:hypothetical protein
VTLQAQFDKYFTHIFQIYYKYFNYTWGKSNKSIRLPWQQWRGKPRRSAIFFAFLIRDSSERNIAARFSLVLYARETLFKARFLHPRARRCRARDCWWKPADNCGVIPEKVSENCLWKPRGPGKVNNGRAAGHFARMA